MAVPTRSTQRQTPTSSTISTKKDDHLPDSVDALSFTQTRKRKAEKSLPNPSKQRHVSCNDRPRIPRDFQAPFQVPKENDNAGEEHVTSFSNLRPSMLSLHDLIRRHRQRLYVHPLQWTLQHLDLLDCQFVDQSQVSRVPLNDVTNRNLQQSVQTQRNAPSQNIKKALVSLRSHSNNDKLRGWAIEDLMAAYGFHHQPGQNSREGDALLLRYGPHDEVPFQVDAFSRSHASVAYLDLDRIESLRANTVYTRSYRRLFQKWPKNEPVKAILEAKLRQIRPSARQYDPFILAVLVALAQEKRRSCATHNATKASTSTLELDTRTKLSHTTDPIASFTQVHVLATSTNKLTRLWTFTARFPASFLNKFDDPSQAFHADPVIISCSEIPLSSASAATDMLDKVFGTSDQIQ
ncbi:hypothetical protein IWW34DRAFT_751871 [Fusarium oxysporum f. sp. albedinis]|nr:hypothetical protein IWW34DRAFT_751871 [Fusarium oxysporum f. sp. albedinis]KAJ0132768.1 Gag protein [Fusarium oxysporum f. sp. albedinis]KAK2468219.1 hypothetical protein H9L39_19865 [Fusarium oxysporum f. sp. albedinis]